MLVTFFRLAFSISFFSLKQKGKIDPLCKTVARVSLAPNGIVGFEVWHDFPPFFAFSDLYLLFMFNFEY